jgi:hypothetical protein
MNATTRIRVLIHCRGAGAGITRTLVSLACQTIGPQRLNIILASTAPAEHASTEAKLLHSALGFGCLEVWDAATVHAAQALNNIAVEGDEKWLALVPEGSRLSPRFITRCLEALHDAKAQAIYLSHTAGSPDYVPLTRVRPFSMEQLTRLNPVGPAVLVCRAAWEILGGLRPTAHLVMWDFWLRLALAGGLIVRVPDLLAYCPPLNRLTPWQDGQAKALLVVSSPGVFEPDVCRWALALLRGDSWAKPFDIGLIPGPRDVRAMFAGLAPMFTPRSAAWDMRGICTA